MFILFVLKKSLNYYCLFASVLFYLLLPSCFAANKDIPWHGLPQDVVKVLKHSQTCNELTADAAFGNLWGKPMGFWTKTHKQLQCAQTLGDIKKLRTRYTEPTIQAALDWAENSIGHSK